MNLEARFHCLRAFLRQNPRIGAACVKDCSHFLRVARSDVQFTDVGQILRISEWLLDLDIGKLTQSDCLFKLSRVT